MMWPLLQQTSLAPYSWHLAVMLGKLLSSSLWLEDDEEGEVEQRRIWSLLVLSQGIQDHLKHCHQDLEFIS